MRWVLCALTLAACPVGGVLAADARTGAAEIAVHGSRDARVALAYEHAPPDVPGKGVRGVLVEHGPGGSSVPHTHPASASIQGSSLRLVEIAR